MKIINRAELEMSEIVSLGEIARIDCKHLYCDNCPLFIERYAGHKVCVKDVVTICLKKNNIKPYEPYERSENEQNN
jgi:hypothetical protein